MSSATALANAGVQAVSAGKYADGIEKLSKALDTQQAPLWFLERSKAYLRTNQIDLALYDAEMALRIAYDRANRDQMIEAQLRRAITLFRMGRFADADVCAFWAIRLCDGAKALEQDGQLEKVDANGDYTPRAKEVQNETKATAQDGLATAMNAAGARSRSTSLRNQAFAWRIQALTQMDNLPAGHDGRKIHVSVKFPERADLSPPKRTTQDSLTAVSHDDDGEVGNGGGNSSNTDPPDDWNKLWLRYHDMYTKHKIRCSFYQTETSLTVDIFLKNLTYEQVEFDWNSRIIKITPNQGISLGGLSSPVVLMLHDETDIYETAHSVKPMKIVLMLRKRTPGKWRNLRCDDADIVDNLSLNPADQGVPLNRFTDFVTALGFSSPRELELPDYDSDPCVWYAALLETLRSKLTAQRGLDSSSGPPVYPLSPELGSSKPEPPKTAIPQASGGAPAYPTSSKSGPKNWDRIDDPDDDENAKSGDVNNFFQSIYKEGNADTKRAMMKSFVESNGTALSTSWSEAQGRTYETNAPDGTEARKWA